MTTAPKRGRGRPRTVDRPDAVARAMDAWWRLGPGAVSLNEICRLTGLSKSSVYREFGGEDGLMAAALAHYRRLRVDPLLALFAQPMPTAATLETLVVASTAPGPLPPGCFFTTLRFARAGVGDGTQQAVDGLVAERLAAFEAWFARGLSAGDANPALTAAGAARYLDDQLTLVLLLRGAGAAVDRVQAQARLALSVLTP